MRCTKYGLQRSKRFDASAYTEERALTLAKARVHRMEYFWCLYQVSGQAAYQYTGDDVRNYVEPPALRAACAGMSARLLKRAEDIRLVRPCRL
eukprot:1667027-Pyramimonas_sp.AAC.1